MMEVVIDERARQFVRTGGGTAFVRAVVQRCCSGNLRSLEIQTDEPRDAADFEVVLSSDVEVRYFSRSSRQPNQLVIEVTGRRRPRLAAYWDGCAFEM